MHAPAPLAHHHLMLLLLVKPTKKKKKGLSTLKFFLKKSNFVWIYHQKKILAVERNFSSSCLCAVLQACRALLLLLPSFLPRQHVVPPIVLLFYLKLSPFPQTHPSPPQPSPNQSQNPPKKGAPDPPPPKKETQNKI
jgi:hypothetical protein